MILVNAAKTRSVLAPFFINAGVTAYERSAKIFSKVKIEELRDLLAGATPLEIKGLRLKRKDKLDEILQ